MGAKLRWVHDALFKVIHMTASVLSLAHHAAESNATQSTTTSAFACVHAESDLINIGNSLVEHSDCKQTLIENALKSIIDNPEMTLEISVATSLKVLEDSDTPEARMVCKFLRDAAAARDKRDAKLLS